MYHDDRMRLTPFSVHRPHIVDLSMDLDSSSSPGEPKTDFLARTVLTSDFVNDEDFSQDAGEVEMVERPLNSRLKELDLEEERKPLHRSLI